MTGDPDPAIVKDLDPDLVEDIPGVALVPGTDTDGEVGAEAATGGEIGAVTELGRRERGGTESGDGGRSETGRRDGGGRESERGRGRRRWLAS